MSTQDLHRFEALVNDDVDRALRAHAGQAGVSNGQQFREWLSQGLDLVEQGEQLDPAGREERLVMRCVYLTTDQLVAVRHLARTLHLGQRELVRRLLRAAFQASTAPAGSMAG